MPMSVPALYWTQPDQHQGDGEVPWIIPDHPFMDPEVHNSKVIPLHACCLDPSLDGVDGPLDGSVDVGADSWEDERQRHGTSRAGRPPLLDYGLKDVVSDDSLGCPYPRCYDLLPPESQVHRQVSGVHPRHHEQGLVLF
jgi:hypothetical protein